jgi:3-oxoacyl-[acyl-carrier protein] reductase
MDEERRTAVVSGGGTGIGRAIARRLALAGHDAIIVGRREDVLARSASAINREVRRDALSISVADLGSVPDVESLAQTVSASVDVLVNDAGGVEATETKGLRETEADWMSHLRSNLLTAVLLTTALEPRLRRPGASIVNVSSIAALAGGGDSYSAAKAAIIGWTLDLAGRLGPDGIRVNAVVPGYVQGTEFFGDRMTPQRHERLVGRSLLGRAGTPDDVAGAVMFLASDDSSYITGQLVHVNGGALLGR